jgi:hypothetical protein
MIKEGWEEEEEEGGALPLSDAWVVLGTEHQAMN